jgi:hypothetical protein
MNVNRVTLSAFGTTGVLLAASLTMLAMVSALVTFDAWPTRDGGASADDIAIERAPNARAVRAVRSTGAGSAATSRRGRATSSTAIGSASFGGGAGGPGGTGPGGNPGPPHVPSGPTPYVPPTPPGEGDPTPGRPVGPRTDRGPDTDPVSSLACGAGSTVAGVTGGAGSAIGTACRTVPPASSSGDGAPQPLLLVSRVLHGGD